MKSYNRMLAVLLFLTVAMFAGCNMYMVSSKEREGDGYYRVEANRIAAKIETEGFDSIRLSEYETITAVYPLHGGDRKNFFEREGNYLIREVGNETYRIEYTTQAPRAEWERILVINILMGIVSAFAIGVLCFLRQKIVKPFEGLKEVPYQLAKGNLTLPVKESKNRFFGKFLWGVDLLRENIEEQKKRELDLQREKKTLVLSISHDIKTPLSAIKLYAKALSRGLYGEKEKQVEIAGSIGEKADEIERFVSEIIRASSEDFLRLEVNMSEFYLSEVVRGISGYYKEKLSLVGIDFYVRRYSDCLLKGDIDRSIEVLQNLIENAAKYGDGHNIEVLFSEEEDCRLITVKNSGCTLSASELPHIFESFWRGSNVGSSSGSGLGLSICRQLMHKMGGEIFAEKKDSDMYVTAVFQKA